MSDPQNGKTDTPRPMEVSRESFDESWERIFGTGRCDKTQDWVESQNVEDCE